jgi:hypothetical protein
MEIDMLKIYLCCILSFFLSASTFANTEPKTNIKHVIYITFDGTRWQDVFNDHSYFQKLWQSYSQQVIFYGAPNSQSTMETATIPVSLPSYHGQMAGSVQPCDGNECGRIQVQTFPENILHTLKLTKKDVVTFSSWPEIGLSVESVMGTTLANTGNQPMIDPITQKPDAVMLNINNQQAADHPDGSDRYDKYTFAQAIHYFEKHQPTFMWISLDDADESAHEKDLLRYHQTLYFYDNALDTLFKTLKKLGVDKNTLVIVTTDHGRGNGDRWDTHGVEFPESKQTWGFVMNGELLPISQDNAGIHYSTLSIRPTIESALGV